MLHFSVCDCARAFVYFVLHFPPLFLICIITRTPNITPCFTAVLWTCCTFCFWLLTLHDLCRLTSWSPSLLPSFLLPFIYTTLSLRRLHTDNARTTDILISLSTRLASMVKLFILLMIRLRSAPKRSVTHPNRSTSVSFNTFTIIFGYHFIFLHPSHVHSVYQFVKHVMFLFSFYLLKSPHSISMPLQFCSITLCPYPYFFFASFNSLSSEQYILSTNTSLQIESPAFLSNLTAIQSKHVNSIFILTHLHLYA